MFGPTEDSPGRTGFDDVAAIHDHGPLGHPGLELAPASDGAIIVPGFVPVPLKVFTWSQE